MQMLQGHHETGRSGLPPRANRKTPDASRRFGPEPAQRVKCPAGVKGRGTALINSSSVSLAFGRFLSSSHDHHRRPPRNHEPNRTAGAGDQGMNPRRRTTPRWFNHPEIQTPATPTGLTKSLHRRHPKSRSVTATLWFLKIHHSPRVPRNRCKKRFLQYGPGGYARMQ